MSDKKNLIVGVSEGILYNKPDINTDTKPTVVNNINFHAVTHPVPIQYYGRYLRLLIDNIDDEVLFNSNITLEEFVNTVMPKIQISNE